MYGDRAELTGLLCTQLTLSNICALVSSERVVRYFPVRHQNMKFLRTIASTHRSKNDATWHIMNYCVMMMEDVPR